MERMKVRTFAFKPSDVESDSGPAFSELSSQERSLIQSSGLPGSVEAFSSDPEIARKGRAALAKLLYGQPDSGTRRESIDFSEMLRSDSSDKNGGADVVTS